jgi:hypothetical protein
MKSESAGKTRQRKCKKLLRIHASELASCAGFGVVCAECFLKLFCGGAKNGARSVFLALGIKRATHLGS